MPLTDFVPKNWTDGTDDVDAGNLERIEQGVADVTAAAKQSQTDISSVGASVGTVLTGILNTDGLPIFATSTTAWETMTVSLARWGLTTWTGKRRWISTAFPNHTPPPNPVAGDYWDDLAGS